MERFHIIRNVFGGSDVYDDSGRQVGYSLPSVLGDGEDFYDMAGNPVGQSFAEAEDGASFAGPGAAGFLDEEFMMGRNAWLDGDPFSRSAEPEFPGQDDYGTGFGPDAGDSFGPDDY